jgi:hypothetical protein
MYINLYVTYASHTHFSKKRLQKNPLLLRAGYAPDRMHAGAGSLVCLITN